MKFKLILVSFLSLFLELCFIRWVPAHVFSVAFFTNIILISSFLGLGLGLLFSEKKYDLFNIFPFILAIGMLLVFFLKNILVSLPPDAETWFWTYYKGNMFNAPSIKAPITLILGLVFFLVGFIFIPVGQRIGKLMKGFSPLSGYTLNITGSLLGVTGFALVSFFNAPSYVWFLIAGIAVAAVLFDKARRSRAFILSIFILAGVVAFVWAREKDMIWSPYYSIQLLENEDKSTSLYINQSFHQRAVNFETDALAREKYMLPYRWIRPREVLVVGSGTGNDIWAALDAGAMHVDAVEIDPVIVDLGREIHPQNPYESQKVRVFTNDARSFMNRSQDRYDTIVYGTLDSHAILSMTSSVRLDNYVYTQEAIEETSQLLTQDGIMVLLFSVPKDWIKTKLFETVRPVFRDARYAITSDSYLFNLAIFAGPGLEGLLSANPNLGRVLTPLPQESRIEPPKDDWPYLYLKKRGLPRLYLITLLILVGVSLASIFMLTPLRGGRINPFFLLLGCGFLLLETKSVTTLSLLFGSTWIVNTVVFSAILALVLLANWLVAKKGPKGTAWFFAGLMLSLAVSYVFPLKALLGLWFSAKVIAAGIIAGLPIFFAAMIFATVFRRVVNPGIALGSNLIGAVLGGFFEYISMVSGLKALYVLALVFYSMAGLILARSKNR